MSSAVEVRPIAAEDYAFIMSSWLKSYRNGSEFGASLRTSLYYSHFRPVVERMIDVRHFAVVTPAGDPGVIVGWICYDGSTVYYAYVKQSFRGMGLFRVLLNEIGLEGEPFRYVFQTHVGEKIARKWGCRYGVP